MNTSEMIKTGTSCLKQCNSHIKHESLMFSHVFHLERKQQHGIDEQL